MTGAGPVLACEGVGVTRQGRDLLRDISLEVRAHERVALIGPNGAGKTTLLRVLGGWLTPDAGSVRIDGQRMEAHDRRAVARRVAAVLASEEAAFPLSVRELVALGRHPWRSRLAPWSDADDAAVRDALEAVELEALALRRVQRLSSGERQRVALARALAQSPEVLLVDEASAHLDLGQQARVVRVLRDQAARCAVVAVFHDLHAAGAFADRVIALREGTVLAAGTTDEVLQPDVLARVFGVPVVALAEVLADAQGGTAGRAFVAAPDSV